MSKVINLQEAHDVLLAHEGPNVGFRNYNGEPCGMIVSDGTIMLRGWWQFKNGSEGGYLEIDLAGNYINDYDGAGNLPGYVMEELESLGITKPKWMQLLGERS